MLPYIPNTEESKKEMLSSIWVNSVEYLFKEDIENE